MYFEFETNISYKYLKEVILNLEEPVCILGGWAVFFHANKNFQKAQGRFYLGSRDIDLGFHIKRESTKEELKESALTQSIEVLTRKLKFKPQGFRPLKDIHTETSEEVFDKKVPAHFIFPMYVDLIVDNIPKNFKTQLGFDPIDEPLLKYAFENPNNVINIKEFNKKLLLPKPELILTMKRNSLPNRDKDHKRIKDICDTFALLWYSDLELHKIKEKLQKFTTNRSIKQCLKSLTDEDYKKAGLQLGHTEEEIKKVMSHIT